MVLKHAVRNLLQESMFCKISKIYKRILVALNTDLYVDNIINIVRVVLQGINADYKMHNKMYKKSIYR